MKIGFAGTFLVLPIYAGRLRVFFVDAAVKISDQQSDWLMIYRIFLTRVFQDQGALDSEKDQFATH